MRRTAALAAALLLSGAAAAVPPSGAEEAAAPPIGVELNRLEPVEGACRAWLVIDNAGGALEALELDLVLFDAEGVILRRLAVGLGPLRGGREAVRVFTLDGLACGAVGRVLINDAPACEGEGAGADCLGRIEARSRAGAPLVN